MTDVIYPKALESFLSQNPSIDIDTDTIKARLVNLTSDYTYSAAHDFIDDVAKYLNSTDQTLGAKTITSGVFDQTSDLTWTSVAVDGSKTVGAVVIYKDTGNQTTSPVIAYYDSFVAILPNGTDVVLTPNGSGLFAL